MRRPRNSRLLAVLLCAAVGALLPSAPADAARTPQPAAAKAIKRVALKACGHPPGGCRYAGARVSTADRRFAWANVGGEGFSGVLLKRPSARSLRFRVAGTQGGGIGSCREWRRLAPRAVLRDLHVSGLLDLRTGRTGSCG